MGTLLNSSLRWWLSFAIAFSPVGHADGPREPVEVLQSDIEGPEGVTQLSFSVQPVEADAAGEVLADAVRQDPYAPVTYFYYGPIDAIHPSLLDLQKRVRQLETLQVGETSAASDAAVAKVSSNPGKWKGILLTVRAAGSYTAAYYLFGYMSGNDVSHAPVMFGLATLISGYQILFTSSWRKLLRASGQLGKSAWSAVAKVFGKAVQEGRVSDQTGRILGAYGFNALTTAAILAVLGGLDSATQIATLAAVGSWDTILDVAYGRQVEKGKVRVERYEKFVSYRLTYGPWLEGPAITLGGTVIGATAGAVLGAVAVAGVVGAYTIEPIQDALERRRKIAANAGAASPKPIGLWQRIKGKFKRKPASAKLRSCERILYDDIQ